MSNSNDSDTQDNDDDESVCVICSGTPCEWDEFGPELLSRQSLMVRREVDDDGIEKLIDSAGRTIQNSKMRLYLYRLFTYLKFGHLGRGNRIPIPNCVTSQIRNLYPDKTYTEFRQALERRSVETANRRRIEEQQREESNQVEEDKQEEDKEGDEDYVDDEEESEDEE